MTKSKWPKLPRYFVPLFHSANVYLATSREEYAQACENLNVDVGSINSLAGTCRHYQNEDTNENLYLIGVFNSDIAILIDDFESPEHAKKQAFDGLRYQFIYPGDQVYVMNSHGSTIETVK